jgi:predicted S18 family serine protease
MKQLRRLTTEHRRSLLTAVLGFLILATVSSRAASDTDVTILKAETLLIESNTVTIIAEATVSVTLTSGGYKPNGTGRGRPGSQITVKASARVTSRE